MPAAHIDLRRTQRLGHERGPRVLGALESVRTIVRSFCTGRGMPELVTLEQEPGAYGFYAWQNIMIACWSKQATGPAVARITLLRESMHDRHPEGVSVIYLIANDAGLPTPEARAGVKDLMARFSQHRACLAIFIQGSGFWASAMRAAVTGVRLMVPLNFAMGIFDDVAALAAWLPERHKRRTGVSIDPARLTAVLQQLERAL